MIFDTDMFIWAQRGNLRAVQMIEAEEERLLSVQTYLELMQGAENKRQHTIIHSFLSDFGFSVLPFSEGISHRASVYIETYAISHGLRAGDALIAATATEHSKTLCSSNEKHFKPIIGLALRVFKP